MKIKLIVNLILICIVTSCCNQAGKKKPSKVPTKCDTVYVYDTVYIHDDKSDEWQEDFGLTHVPDIDSIWGKPVSYYLNDEKCNPIAFEFYYGYFQPSDDGATAVLLDLSDTDNKKLRPFYRWCLDKTIQVSDGALGELIGVPARQYAEKFPDEFFEFMDKEKDRYEDWVSAIQYSGFFDLPDYENNEKQRKNLVTRMTKNLKVRNQTNIERIKKFANDCVSYPE